MLYYLISLIPGYKGTPLRLFDYTTFRAGGAMFTTFLLCVIFGPMTVRLLKKLRTNAPTRLEGLIEEKYIDHAKDATPSMGGLLIVASIFVSTIFWGKIDNHLLQIFLGALLLFCGLGFWDDYSKIASHKKDGISERTKLIAQTVISLIALFLVQRTPELHDYFNELHVPFLKTAVWIMPTVIAYAFSALVVIGACNAVNLTDGKDGLAVGCTIFCILTYGAFAYMASHKIFADHLGIQFISGAEEVVVLATAIAGSCIGFLWYNCHPASMFMGDTGSLALGGVIGLIAVLIKQELLLVIVGGVFVMEAGSVLIQRASFKLTGKRVFRCSPIHHHFEKGGWTETQIVVRFWILAGIFAMIGLATLKLR